MTSVLNAREIEISAKVSKSHRASIERDLEVLRRLQFSKTPPRALEILGLKRLDNITAYDWLTQRVGYIVADQKFEKVSELVKKKIVYEKQYNVDYFEMINLKKLITSDETKDKVEEKAEAITVMSNIGTSIYNWGKANSRTVGFKFLDADNDEAFINITSPRTGIIEIGEGLFSPRKTINPRRPKSVANSIARLVTFFHEARHSDGNGASLGFYHSMCPAKHDMEGQYACDENLNGAYSVGAVMFVEMIVACEDECTLSEKEVLKIAAMDSLSRVQKTTKSGRDSIDLSIAPESI